ncbi:MULTISPECIES: ABC transporter ATP-binding protein [Sphingobacterium]|uniref:ABC transporter ATP-binding protein n=1 Tax=Sphingobacterium cellulitidis TaxID=1768011 RepID=A0A8H9KTZ8_9SPHI|nr:MULTISPECIES: ABC transporter ATP-binding protein [Sphingobacterium]MBA8985743.1 ABC-type lipoprotein export system ATPase subunit [Sphingobacterium soli]OYD43789.1 phosphonate ABC transporter ATP-binding protein [Sphingobacterium cellulitidis]OYD47045.1 phosphonate ABC transporter ATP-binding protein [Sphingobacterium cellulitidis]WFB64154.1 ABC transporter ATP-binding protein [Sphingobacterium sp. WM]GGE07253.1 ABC transporter ATP-binding protein [Sphingobacterium soli]
MIKLEHIFKWYSVGGAKNFILKDINLEINEGDFVSIMGPSGSGKSTLLNVIGMLDEPDEGSYTFMGEDVLNMKAKKRSQLFQSHIGYVFQSYHLIDELTVYENIETPLIYKNLSSSERKSIVSDMLDRFNIVGKKDLFPAQLSGGQQQVVGIARALAGSPRLLLADEPTGNLNSKQGEEIMELFKQLNDEGMTIIQVTHSEKNAEYGKSILNMLDGQLK